MIKAESRSSNTYKVCSDCGITHTPLWRGGPNGPKTMCNACGIRWKRAHQNGNKASKQYNDQKLSKLDYLSEEEERSEDDSAEELLALSDPETNTFRSSNSSEDKESNEASPRKKKSMKRKHFQNSARGSKPYSRRSSPTPVSENNRELENEAEDSMLLLQQAAEEFDRITVPLNTEAVSSPIGASLNGSANASPVPINQTPNPQINDQVNQLFSEVRALREEVQKRDAIIGMFKTTPAGPLSFSTAGQHGKTLADYPPLTQHIAM